MTRTGTTTVAISGGGPAGIMLGLLLARAGIDVTVVEKHGDFLRDFRGDTVHPSTLRLLDELGLAGAIEQLPHRKVRAFELGTAEGPLIQADLGHLPGRYQYVAMVPQWDFLTLLVDHAKRYPGFGLLMNAEATETIEENGAVRGIRYTGQEGEHELRAVLTVSADGRHSRLREAAGMVPTERHVPMDVLWMRVERHSDDETGLYGRVGNGSMLVAFDRGSYWQVAYLIPKDGLEEIRSQPISVLQDRMLALLPELGETAVRSLDDWDRVAFLRVALNRLDRWYRPGYLCIGDAAHAMTPVGGVGINLAVQDAVATANLLADALYRAQGDPDRFGKTLNPELLARVQRRRWMPTVGTQRLQQVLQDRVISRVLAASPATPLDPPLMLRVIAGAPIVPRLVIRTLMLGLRPEHVHTPERPTAAH
ncbi:FAD-dependent oxidoreductase [Nocardiopsis rhodophaea]|uniref:FAD-dependent oxidoreductase n=1 Tax=Nocardiopsis rhodophaea TaxID=280238 RepID=UPI0031E38F3A